MYDRDEQPAQYAWIVYGVALLMTGGLGGYIIAVQEGRASGVRPSPAAVSTPAPSAAAVTDEAQLQAYRDILARDPKNVAAAVAAGNLLYDAHRYHEAIGFYQQGFAASPSDVNVSTDLATALWYSGRPDDALAQYDKSLALNATHPQTLFNLGIVLAEGKHEYARAVDAWEKLLRTNPAYPEVSRVQSLIAEARQKIGAAQ